jgi:transposase-like protein
MTRRSAKQRWKQWTEAEARAALAAWEDSGESMVAHARKLGVSSHRLSYWRARLAPSRELAFVPVVGPARADACIVIERAGVVLRVRESLDPALLTGILTALARVEAPC